MPPAVAARRAPYKDFLQPALQRRFAGTAAIILALAYFEALTLSSWQSLIWSWFPVGLPGIRALAIFASVLLTLILRIAYSHMGIRSSASPFETIVNSALPFRNFMTILIYGASAWFFSQAYLMSTPEESGIRWITHASGRARLNEQAVFYTVSVTVLGVVHGVLHIVRDQDQLVLGTVKAKNADEAAKSDHWAAEIGDWLPVIVLRSGMLAIASGLFNYAILYPFLRKSSWTWYMRLFRIRYSELPKSNLPPYSGGPWSFWMLLRTIWASFLLSLLWHCADIVFHLLLSHAPLKNDRSLTAESKDPNSSLLNGLKSKKERVSAFAMWELALIARDSEARRKAIFDDIDRKDGPMWPQIYGICIDVIRGLERRIDDYGKPPAPAASVPAAETAKAHERIAQPIRTDDVLIPRASSKTAFVKRTVSKVVTSPGRTPAEDYGPELKRRAADVADRLMTKEQQAALKPKALQGRLGELAMQALTLPVIGPLFQSTFGRRLIKAVIGSPYAELSVYVNAAFALSQLAVCSLTEDKYGNVQRDVPSIIRTLTAVIKKLERFRDEFPMHWTDVGKSRECPEVEKLLAALKDDLDALVTAFAPYSSDLRLTRADMRLAREAAEKGEERVVKQDAEGPEMQQAS